MKQYVCENCGSHDFFEQNGYKICHYCGSKFQMSSTDVPLKCSTIALEDDVSILLRKCQADPNQAHRYASLVLDIDPSNKEAARYLKKR